MIPGWLWFGDNEIANATRTRQYLRKLAPTTVAPAFCNECGDCDDLTTALGHPEYVSPALDPAPWVSPTEPGSDRFLGFYPTGVEGLDDTPRTATMIQSIADGGWVIGERLAPREVRVRGVLLGLDQQAVSTGMAWLSHALDCEPGALCGQGKTFRYLLGCPDLSQVDPVIDGQVPDQLAAVLSTSATGPFVSLVDGDTVEVGVRSGSYDLTSTTTNPGTVTVVADVSGSIAHVSLAVQGTGNFTVEWAAFDGPTQIAGEISAPMAPTRRSGAIADITGADKLVVTYVFANGADVTVEKPTLYVDVAPVSYYNGSYPGAQWVTSPTNSSPSTVVSAPDGATWTPAQLTLNGGSWVTATNLVAVSGGFIACPPVVKAGGGMAWTWNVTCFGATTGSLEVISDGQVVKTVNVSLSAGANTLTVDDDGLVATDAYCAFRPAQGVILVMGNVTLSYSDQVELDEVMYGLVRELRGAKPVEGPTTIGDRATCNLVAREVELIIATGSPATYRQGIDVVSWNGTTHVVHLPEASVEVLAAELPACVPVVDPPIVDPTLPPVPPPPQTAPPPVSVPTDYERTIVVHVPPLAPEWLTAAPVITLTPTAGDVRDIRVRFIPGSPTDTAGTVDPCDSTGGFFVSYLPGGYDIVVDATTQSIYAVDPDGARVPGSHLVSAETGDIFAWPTVVGSSDYWIHVDSEDPGVGVTLELAVSE